MKRKLFLPLMAMGSFLTLVSNNTDVLANTGYGGGAGTESNPYLISTPEHLNQLRLDVNVNGIDTSGKYYRLTNDIDLMNFDTDNDASNGNWEPIGSFDDGIAFSGVFDGDGFKIKNMTINNQLIGGFFLKTDGAEIKNLELLNIQVDTYVYGATLIGLSGNTIVEKVSASGTVSSDTISGGLVGVSGSSTYRDCYTNVSVTAVSGHEGGIIAGSSGFDNLTNCFIVGRLSNDFGAIVGQLLTDVEGVYSTVTNCYWDVNTTTTTGEGDPEGGKGLTTSQMTGENAKTNMKGFDFKTVWQTTDSYPVFRWQSEDVETEVQTNEREISLNGNVQSTVLSLNVPSNSLTFVLNPNEESGKQFIASEFELMNGSQAPLTLELKTFEQVTDILNDVEPTEYADWSGLNKEESKDIALALVPKVGEGWLTLNEGNRWVANLGELNIGTIKGNSTVSFGFEAKQGSSFTETLTPQYRLTFVFGLQD